jgi:hypothetical protein
MARRPWEHTKMARQASKRRRHVQKSCTAKQRFESEVHVAKLAAKRGITYYRCPVCRGFHLTSRGIG